MSGNNNCLNTTIPLQLGGPTGFTNNGGTGNTSTATPYGVLFGPGSVGYTMQSVASLGNSGDMLTLQASGLPVFMSVPIGGVILQAVQTIVTTQKSYSISSSYVTTDLSVSITPASTSSKILIMCSMYILNTITAGAGFTSLKLNRGATAINLNSNASVVNATALAAASDASCVTLFYLDSPATVSSTTYSISALLCSATGTTTTGFAAVLNTVLSNNTNDVGGTSTIIALEMKG